MTVVTGETGAGKTMVVSGIGLLLGARADAGIVRHGAARAIVEGRFTDLDVVDDALGELGAELTASSLVPSGRSPAQGRSRAFIGGAQSPISRLAVLTGELATIHGQPEQLRLGNPERQREVPDRSGGPKLAAVLAREPERAYRTREELGASNVTIVRNARGAPARRIC